MEWDDLDEIPGSDEGEELLPIVPYRTANASQSPAQTSAAPSPKLNISPRRATTPPRKRRKLDHLSSDDDDEDPLRLRPGDFARQDDRSGSPTLSELGRSSPQLHPTPSRRSAPPSFTPASPSREDFDPLSATPSSRADTPPWSTGPTATSPPRLIKDDAFSQSSSSGSRYISPLTDLDDEDVLASLPSTVAQDRPRLPWSQMDDDEDDDLPPNPETAVPAVDIVMETAGANQEEVLELPPDLIEHRYPKRRRTEQQLKPYGWDMAIYRDTMRGNKDAVVRTRDIRREEAASRANRYEDDEGEAADDDDDEQSEGQVSPGRRPRRRSRSRSRGPNTQCVGSPPTLDGDGGDSSPAEDAEVAAYRKEADSLRAQQKREEREKKKREAQERREANTGRLMNKRGKRAKEFPISANSVSDREEGPSSRRRVRRPSPPPRRAQSPSPARGEETTSRRRLRRASSSAPASPSSCNSQAPGVASFYDEDQPFEGHFPDFNDGAMDLDDPPFEGAPTARRSSSVVSVQDSVRVSSSESSEEEEEPLERSAEALEKLLDADPALREQRKLLGKLYPAKQRDEYMWEIIEKRRTDARDRQNVRRERTRRRVGPLMPGQAQARRSGAARVREVKGDSESEEEVRDTPRNTPSPPRRTSRGQARMESPPPRRRQQPTTSATRPSAGPTEVVDISDDETVRAGAYDVSSSDSDSDVVEDAQMTQFVEELRRTGPSTQGLVRERNHVDYMLDRTMVHGGPRGGKKKKKAKSSGRSKPHTLKGPTRDGAGRRSHGARQQQHRDSGGRAPRHSTAEASRQNAGPSSSRPRNARSSASRQQNATASSSRHQNATASSSRQRNTKASSNRLQNAGASSSYQTTLADYEFDLESDHDEFHSAPDLHSDPEPHVPHNPFSRAAQRSTKRGRKKAVRKQPPYTFGQSGQTAIAPNLYLEPRQFEMFLQHEGFNEQLRSKQSTSDPKVPSRPWQSQNNRALSPFRANTPLNVPDGDSLAHDPSPRLRSKHTTLDLAWLRKLNGRVSFAPTTYIGKGYIDELVRMTKGDTQPTEPYHFCYNGYDLHSACTTATFLESLGELRQELMREMKATHGEDDLATGMRLQGAVRAHCHLLSWLHHHRPVDEVTLVGSRVEAEARLLLTEAAAQSASPVTHTMLTISWFVVEAIARLGRKLNCIDLSVEEGSIYGTALSHLCSHLIRLGILESCSALDEGGNILDSKTLGQRSAELWISLQHLTTCTVTVRTQGATSSPSHPLGIIAHSIARREMTATEPPFRQGERRWQLIFGLCYLSQFSTMGRPRADQRFATSWSLVAEALKSVELGVSKELEPGVVPDQARRLLDEYAGQLMRRCAHLWTFWGWELASTGSVLVQLLAVSRSRKYSNLVEEDTEFPEFLRKDPSLLFTPDATCNTALEMYVKLAFSALVNGKQVYHPVSVNDRVPQNTARKIYSSFSPTSQLVFSRDHPPFTDQQSSLINRFTIIAMYIALEPEKTESMLMKLRGYMDFGNMELTTRATCIRGAMYLGMFLVKIDLSPEPCLAWLTAMLETLMNELPSAPKEHRSVATGGDPPIRVKMAIMGVLQAMTRVLVFHRSCSKPGIPLAFLHSSLFKKRIFGHTPESPAILENSFPSYVVREFIQSCLDVLPSSKKHKKAVLTTDFESQEEFAELDAMFMEDGFMEALNVEEGKARASQETVEESAVAKLIKDQVLFRVFMLTQKKFTSPDETSVNLDDYTNDANAWIECWLGCAAVIVRNGLEGWDHYIAMSRFSYRDIISLAWRARTCLKVMQNLFSVEPKTFHNATLQGDYTVVLLNGLTTPHTPLQIEFLEAVRDYVNASEEQHPLLHEVQFPTEQGYTSPQHLAAQRLRAIRSICDNFEQLLASKSFNRSSAVAYCEQYSQAFSDALLTMKEVCTTKTQKRDEHPDCDVYVAFCKDVATTMSDHAQLNASLTNVGKAVLEWGTTTLKL